MKHSYGSVLGVDGCRGGWAAVYLEVSGFPRVSVFQSLRSLFKTFPSIDRVLLDIPIGLPGAGAAERECDRLGRFLLPARKSSVFRVPVRKAVYAPNYKEALRRNRAEAETGLSMQSWRITAKMREADLLLRRHARLRDLWYESHPELCFMALNRGRPLAFVKKSREGVQERLGVLVRNCKGVEQCFNEALRTYPRKILKADDILDALALAVSARLSMKQGLAFLPPVPPQDSEGLPMRIVFPQLRKSKTTKKRVHL